VSDPAFLCNVCGVRYPKRLLAWTLLGGFEALICGVCALESSNEMRGQQRRKFRVPQAEARRQAALAWRRDHPKG